MIYCIKCGEKAEDGMKFCPRCGAPLPEMSGAEKTHEERHSRRISLIEEI